MKISHTKKFTSRAELDSFIRSRFGEKNRDKELEIELSEDEAKALQLSEDSTVFEAVVKVKKK